MWNFDPNKLLRIEGLAPEESESLMAELRTYMVQPEADYTLRLHART